MRARPQQVGGKRGGEGGNSIVSNLFFWKIESHSPCLVNLIMSTAPCLISIFLDSFFLSKQSMNNIDWGR